MTPAAILAASEIIKILVPFGIDAITAIERAVVALHNGPEMTPTEKSAKVQFLISDATINATLAHLDANG
jgi:hypothetical protein